MSYDNLPKEKQEIIKKYSKEFLKPLLGQGKVQRELVDGLVKVLSSPLGKPPSGILDSKIDKSFFSVRIRNVFTMMRIETYRQLLEIPESELLGYKNFGESSLREVKKHLADLGLYLKLD